MGMDEYQWDGRLGNGNGNYDKQSLLSQMGAYNKEALPHIDEILNALLGEPHREENGPTGPCCYWGSKKALKVEMETGRWIDFSAWDDQRQKYTGGFLIKLIFTPNDHKLIFAEGTTEDNARDWLADHGWLNSWKSRNRGWLATYNYVNSSNEVLYQVRVPRLTNGKRDHNKHPSLARWDAAQNKFLSHKDCMRGVPRVLYNLPDINMAVRDGERIFVVEGEKCADVLNDFLGRRVATTNAMGGGNPWLPEYTETLRGAKEVIILPDNDSTGETHARKVAHALAGAVATIRVLGLPGLAEKGDVADWIAAGGTLDKFIALGNEAPSWDDAAYQATRWQDELQRDKHDDLLPTATNIHTILLNDPDWDGVFRYNELANIVYVENAPPYFDPEPVEGRDEQEWRPRAITDDDEEGAIRWFEKHGILKPPFQILFKEIKSVALKRAFNPAQDYMRAAMQTWLDAGRPCMLDTAGLTFIPNATRQPVIDSAGNTVDLVNVYVSKLLMSIAARVMQPGCKSDNMCIFIGPQDINKGLMVAIIGLDDHGWYADGMPSLDNQDNLTRHIQGKIVVQWTELASLRVARVEQFKSFLTRQYDRMTNKYEKHAEDYPRIATIIGTANPGSEGIFKDDENRRFHVIECGTETDHKIDLDWLRDNIELLYGEAVYRVTMLGEKWWITDEKLLEAKAEHNEEFAELLSGTDDVTAFIAPKETVLVSEVASLFCISVSFSQMNLINVTSRAPGKHEQMRAASILMKLGWERKRQTRDGRKLTVYHRGPKAAAKVDGDPDVSAETFLKEKFTARNLKLVGAM